MLNNDRGGIFRWTIFFLTPFFSLPFVLAGIYRKNKTSVYLLIGLISIVSYLYMPTLENDKSVYYFFYEDFKQMSFSSWLTEFLIEKPDYIFYLLIYIFSIIDIPIDFLFFSLTFISLTFLVKSFLKLLKNLDRVSEKMFCLFVLLVWFSVSPPSLFSGIRFTLASVIVVYAFISSISLDHKSFRGVFLIVIASLIHFSTWAFLPIYFVVFYLKRNYHKLFLVLFLLSFVFVLLPKSFLLNGISTIGLSNSIEMKAQGYLDNEDFITNGLNVGNFNNYLMIQIKSVWIVLSVVYVLMMRNKISVLKNSFLLIGVLTNLFYVVPTVYLRYVSILLFFFIFLIIKDFVDENKNLKTIYLMFAILSLSFFGNIYALRQTLDRSIMNVHSLTLPTILLKDNINYEDIR
jgi:hypothetical protein